ncbi:MAG: diacylglycerol kinase family lipid kinase [Actinobacteria bacterium]|nr:MAG: diacylglycerol kinase family lipid kinase [Actinomycetota bacterium]TMK19052.1 MAG: diacylglycerol kinase family lipid kinase [Actinomycetota bacterium]TMK92506.1 MAG: diacylglycerol kinase family lipid kinase [Actinomycetota bacterium]TMM23876.1 MAG: diacylglycerol kinase family lipid kinase [Actinomycetota bacterium]
MTSVAVLAHAGKSLGGGLPELRAALAGAGVDAPVWYEVSKSKQAPKKVEKAVADGADLLFVWGGDGMLQRCIDAVATTSTTIAIVPAGTANLLARNLGIPNDIEGAVHIGLHGGRRMLDVGVMNGERFAVMAGTGLDALMIRDMGDGLKGRAGKLGYVWAGARHLGEQRFALKIRVDGRRWFSGKASSVLLGNVGTVLGGLTLFRRARPDDGKLEIGVVTAKGLLDWGRALGRSVISDPERSPFVHVTSGRAFEIRLDRKRPYELDGGDRKPTKRFRVSVEPAAVAVCVASEMP